MSSEDLFSTEPEVAVLSTILQLPEKVYELHGVKSFMFSSAPNQLLFSTIEELLTQGLTPEVNLIDNYLKSKGRDLQVGGKEYLNYLIKQQYSPENIKEFERLVINSYKARSLISLSSRVNASIRDTQDVDTIISSIRSTLDSLTSSSGGELTSPIDNVLKSTWEDLLERVKNPGIRGTSTGIKDLDTATSGLNKGDLWIIAGRPSMGKTAQMCNMLLNQGKMGIPTLVFSLEMSKQQLAERLICIETGIPTTNIRLGMVNQKQMDEISDAMKRIKGLPIFIDSNFTMDLNYAITTTRKFKRTHDIKVVYLDYIQLLAERNAESTNELGRISRAFKLLANELEISSIIGSQLNRNVETREDKHPQLSDLRQSGNLEEDSDLVIGLYRDVMYNAKTKDKSLMEDIILKQRNGARGMLPLKFIEECGRIQSYGDK